MIRDLETDEPPQANRYNFRMSSKGHTNTKQEALESDNFNIESTRISLLGRQAEGAAAPFFLSP